jgi:hypothetical protein
LDTRAADHRADVYSLGCTLYYLLAGRAMYQGESVMRTIFAHREQPIPPLRDVRPEASTELDAIFHKMVAKNVEDRYQSMAELIADLEACTPLLSQEQAAGPKKSRLIAAAAPPPASAPTATDEGVSSSSQVADFLADLGTNTQRKRVGTVKAASKGMGVGAGGRSAAGRSAEGPSIAERLAAVPPLWWVVGGSGAMLLVLIAVLIGLVIVFFSSSPSGDAPPDTAVAPPGTAAKPPGNADKPPTGTGDAPPRPAETKPAPPAPKPAGTPPSPAISSPALPVSPAAGKASSAPPGNVETQAMPVRPAPNNAAGGGLAGAIAASAKGDGSKAEPSGFDKPFPKIDFQFPGTGGGGKPGEWRAMLEPDALAHWKQLPADSVQDGVLRLDGPSGVITAPGYYKHFELEIEFRLGDAGDSGLGIFYSGNGNPAQQGIEVQLVDDERNMQNRDTGRCASLYDLVASEGAEFRRWPAWNQLKARATGEQIVVELNGKKVVSANREQLRVDFPRHAGVLSDGGQLCLYPIRGEQEYRGFRVRELP